MVDIWVEPSVDFRNNKLKVVMEFTEEERIRSVPNVQDFISLLLMIPEKQEKKDHVQTFGDREAELLTQVLIYHYRKDDSSCGCGWGKLGHSHAEHVVEVFKESILYLKE